MGLTINDLDLIDAGMVLDMMTEGTNDSFYADKNNQVRTATQADFDKFKR